MAKMNLTNPMSDDEGYPTSRCVDGTNVRECASQEGSFLHFGKIRKGMRMWSNSKTGKRMDAPSYHNGDDSPPHGSGF